MSENFLPQNYLTCLLALPIVFALALPFLKPNEGSKNIHFYGVGASVVLFLFSSLAWLVTGRLKGDGLNLLYNSLTEVHPWFPNLGIHYAVGADGLSLTMMILTTFLLVMASVASITNIKKRVKLYYGMLFILTTAVMGVFLARDSFLFFLFYELELIPMYLLIAIWGGPNRKYASLKFVLYTLFGSVFLLAGILGLYFHISSTGGIAVQGQEFLFPIIQAHAATLAPTAQLLIFLAFFIGFGVKLPMVPFHTWLPDAHVEAPTPVSMLLAGILLKMGAYGMMRFCWEYLPEAAYELAPWVAALAVINIVYTAGVALVQKDLKKLIAYSSVSHMGFVLLGLAAMNELGFNGAVFVMFAHGIVSAALFMCVGTLYTRTHTRMIADFGGLGKQVPVIFYFFMFMSMASLGLPLLISFASETLVFYGAFLSDFFHHTIPFFGLKLFWHMRLATLLSALGIIIGAAYLLWMLKRVFFGEMPKKWNQLADASRSEVFVLATLALLVMGYGFQPALITHHFEAEVSNVARMYPMIHARKQMEASAARQIKGPKSTIKQLSSAESISGAQVEDTVEQQELVTYE